MREHSKSVEWIIANTINETAQGDPDGLATRIVAALKKAGYLIVPGILGSRPLDGLDCPEKPNLNTGTPWSSWDDDDIRWGLTTNSSSSRSNSRPI